MSEASLPQNWLADLFKDIDREIATWPEWKQVRLEQMATAEPVRDPCQKPGRCSEAQTCVGGCGLYNWNQDPSPNRPVVPEERSDGEG